jgi:hypothetical protein
VEDLAIDISTPIGIAMITVISVSLLKHLVLNRFMKDAKYYRETILGIASVSCAILSLLSRYITEAEPPSWYVTLELLLSSYAATIAGFETVGKRIENMLTEWLTPKSEDQNEK